MRLIVGLATFVLLMSTVFAADKDGFFVGVEHHANVSLTDVLKKSGSTYSVVSKEFNVMSVYKLGYRSNIVKWYLIYAGISCGSENSILSGGGIGVNLTQVGFLGMYPKVNYNYGILQGTRAGSFFKNEVGLGSQLGSVEVFVKYAKEEWSFTESNTNFKAFPSRIVVGFDSFF